MSENIETAMLQSFGSPDTDGLYCEECLRVDQSFDDIRNTATKKEDGRLPLSLKDKPGDIKAQAKCPSCKDIRNLLGAWASTLTDNLHLDFSVCVSSRVGMSKHGIHIKSSARYISGHLSKKDIHLFRRSNYPMRLRNNSSISAKASNLPIALIKPWLETCEYQHKGCRPDAANKLKTSIYVIDVVKECIVYMSASKIRYVALSYVWGNAEPTKLTSENLDTLRKPRSLSETSRVATVPRTIRDAMHLTADLNIRYLWVDSLCLVQDDPNMGLYLSQMHLIYNNAYLTVVVADKNSANDGIIGYEDCSPGRVLPGQTINYPNYVLGIEDYCYEDKNLPWRERGWTLQEGVFSRRALVITDRVCLICASSFHEEGEDFGHGLDFHRVTDELEILSSFICKSSPDSLDDVSRSTRSIQQERSTYADMTVRRGSTQPFQKIWSTYTDIASEFAIREFSHDSDVIKAFAGVMTFFTTPKGSGDKLDLIFGHPADHFERSLLWTSEGFPVRRRAIPSRQDGLPGIPSWSWMAWKHSRTAHFQYYFGPWDEMIGDFDIPTVIHIQCGYCLKIHEVTDRRCRNGKSSEITDWEILHPYLYIRAQRALFGALKHPADEDEDTEDATVLISLDTAQNQEASIVGKLEPDIRPLELPEDGSNAFEFVGIRVLQDFDGLVRVEALCVKRSDNHPSVCERVGVACIRKDAWEQVAQFDENIILG